MIKFCVELGKTPVETQMLLKQTRSGSTVSSALVYRWHKRFSDEMATPVHSKGASGAGRPSVISEELTSTVKNLLQQDARFTVREIALKTGVGVATAHKL